MQVTETLSKLDKISVKTWTEKCNYEFKNLYTYMFEKDTYYVFDCLLNLVFVNFFIIIPNTNLFIINAVT